MKRWLIAFAVVVAFVAIFFLSRHVLNPTTTTTTSTTTSTPPVTTTTSGSSTTTTTTALATTCRGADFTGAFVQGQGAAGTIYAGVKLTKTTAGSCTLKGWPLLTLQDKDGAVLTITQVNQPSSTSSVQFAEAKANEAPSLVTMNQKSTVQFSFAYSDVTTGTTACVNATTMNVRFTRNDTSIVVTPQFPLQPCNNGTMWVSPFYS